MSGNVLKSGLSRRLGSLVACVVVAYSTHAGIASHDLRELQAKAGKGFANQELAETHLAGDGVGHSDAPSLGRTSRSRRGGCSLVANRRIRE